VPDDPDEPFVPLEPEVPDEPEDPSVPLDPEVPDEPDEQMYQRSLMIHLYH
jgi:hypothetical protein